MRLSYGAALMAFARHEQHRSEVVLMRRIVNFAFLRKLFVFVEEFRLLGACRGVNFVRFEA
ncbi:hypothetical protein D2V17_16215 [Aurantiacibacter xanthus]|uniref:Uncharacterized protein n=1 Tax=Aurantiacibacter xanthus TaxID=1784712 RepID=A0A3A1P4P8_9SPHN|nr:hypothetical protein D2V17_16215 [Aurantiacibacter xanthus]